MKKTKRQEKTIKLKKSTALHKLNSCTERIDAVKSRYDDEAFFAKWKRDAEVVIRYVFGEESSHLEEFREINYYLQVSSSDTPDSDYQGAFEDGLEEARAILSSMIKEIEEFWGNDEDEDGKAIGTTNSKFDPWGPVSAVLFGLRSADTVLSILNTAGFVLNSALSGGEDYSHGTRIRAYQARADIYYQNLASENQRRFILNVVRALALRSPESIEYLNQFLKNIGWIIIDDSLVPLSFIDPKDIQILPASARADLVKAAARLLEDPTGAISAACGAVDNSTTVVYRDNGLENVQQASFQERVNKSLQAKKIFLNLETELRSLGWEDKKTKEFSGNLKSAISHAAKVMETLRSQMGDVHGTKPVFDPLVYDSIKWAMIICSLLK